MKTVQTENRGAKELPEAVDEFIQILMTRLVFSLGQRLIKKKKASRTQTDFLIFFFFKDGFTLY